MLSETGRRMILDLLQRQGTATAQEIAVRLNAGIITDRLHDESCRNYTTVKEADFK